MNWDRSGMAHYCRLKKDDVLECAFNCDLNAYSYKKALNLTFEDTI